MHIDRYVKIILTIIAAELLWIGLKDGATPVVAQAQRAPTSVVITGIELSGPEAGFLPVAVVGGYRRIPAAAREAVDRLTAGGDGHRARPGPGAREGHPVGDPGTAERYYRTLRVETERPLDVAVQGTVRVTAERPLRVESVPYTPSKGPGE